METKPYFLSCVLHICIQRMCARLSPLKASVACKNHLARNMLRGWEVALLPHAFDSEYSSVVVVFVLLHQDVFSFCPKTNIMTLAASDSLGSHLFARTLAEFPLQLNSHFVCVCVVVFLHVNGSIFPSVNKWPPVVHTQREGLPTCLFVLQPFGSISLLKHSPVLYPI